MDEALQAALAQPDLDKVLLQAVAHADATIRKYIWRGFRPKFSANNEVMVGDMTAQDFSMTALERLLHGVRTYDSGRSLLDNLNSTTDSLIWSAKKSSDRTGIVDYVEETDEEGHVSNPITEARSDEFTAAEILAQKEIIEDQRRCFQTLRASFDGDSDMQSYLDALSVNFHKPADIADLTEMPIERVYELRRKLKNYVAAFYGVQNFAELQRRLLDGTQNEP